MKIIILCKYLVLSTNHLLQKVLQSMFVAHILKQSSAFVAIAYGSVCCYKGVCPTAERCNACIAGLTLGTLSRRSELLCKKFWGDKCYGRERSSCHAFSTSKLLTESLQSNRFNCINSSNGNRNCHWIESE